MSACLRAWVTFTLLLTALLCTASTRAEDGYDLWLRYRPLAPAQAQLYRSRLSELIIGAATPTQNVARSELQRGLHGLLDREIPLTDNVTRDGALIVGTSASSTLIARLSLDSRSLGKEGYLIRSMIVNGHAATVIAAHDDIGALYGTFHFLRLLQTGQPIDRLDLRETPRLKLRMLDHWDYLNGQVERGYAGASIWDWWKLPDWRAPRYTDYA
ncbi:MAG: alpha-glucuronidase family glycosyl hydrolase, partial [Dyella sp.]|uniref:alpha-glucuronidase family glycosyl hydrolase n=1 Tax=Dyella sp. TaxID=1869338 RepID=UPI003F7D7057